MLRGCGRLRTGGAAIPVYPLDDVGGVAPVFAYGIKKMRAAYSGNAVRVVRPSDSAAQDIGFYGQSIDFGALSTFLGAETGQVSIWYDQSGNGNDATQVTAASRPRISTIEVNGARVVWFNVGGTATNMDLPGTASINRTSYHSFTVLENYESNRAGAAISVGSGTSSLTNAYFGSNTTAGGLRTISGIADSAFPTVSSPSIYEISSSATGASSYQDDESVTATALTNVAMVGGSIGKAVNNAGYDLLAYGCAFIAYGRVLNSTERNAMRTGLRTLFRFGDEATRIVFEGDSITQALHIDGYYGYAKQAQRMIGPGVIHYNMAITGQTAAAQVTQYANEAGKVLTRYSGNRIVFLAAGTNDLGAGVGTPAQVYSSIQSYAASVRTDGGKIIVSTLLPRVSWGSSTAADRDTLNGLIRSGWASFADGLADFAADPVMGPASAASDTSLYLDGLHPTRLGHSYLALVAYNAIRPLL